MNPRTAGGYAVGFLTATLIALTIHAYQANHPEPLTIPAPVCPVEAVTYT
jgi:hypothetical protein